MKYFVNRYHIMAATNKIRLTECPRDAMQGMKTFVPTDDKIIYINSLLKVGFDILDFGSFVSPKAIPQLSDTAKVLAHLNMDTTATKLLAIIGNMRGAKEASQFDEVSYLGFPFSISDTFLKLNINTNVNEAFGLTHELLELCDKTGKELMVYLSMAFGNLYNDPWSPELVADWVYNLKRNGASEINLADTVGVASAESVRQVFGLLVNEFPDINFGFHLHAKADEWYDKVDIAYQAGCKNFDGVLSGMGGCPMSGSAMVENLHMKNLVDYFDEKQVGLQLNRQKLDEAYQIAMKVLADKN